MSMTTKHIGLSNHSMYGSTVDALAERNAAAISTHVQVMYWFNMTSQRSPRDTNKLPKFSLNSLLTIWTKCRTQYIMFWEKITMISIITMRNEHLTSMVTINIHLFNDIAMGPPGGNNIMTNSQFTICFMCSWTFETKITLLVYCLGLLILNKNAIHHNNNGNDYTNLFCK